MAVIAEIKVTDLDPERLRIIQELLWKMRSKTVADLHELSPALEPRCEPVELLRDLFEHAAAIENGSSDGEILGHSDAIMRGVKMLKSLRVVASEREE